MVKCEGIQKFQKHGTHLSPMNWRYYAKEFVRGIMALVNELNKRRLLCRPLWRHNKGPSEQNMLHFSSMWSKARHERPRLYKNHNLWQKCLIPRGRWHKHSISRTLQAHDKHHPIKNRRKYVCFDIENFYLSTPLNQPEYVKIQFSKIPKNS